MVRQAMYKTHEGMVIPCVWLSKPLHLRSNVLRGS